MQGRNLRAANEGKGMIVDTVKARQRWREGPTESNNRRKPRKTDRTFTEGNEGNEEDMDLLTASERQTREE
jgi:hypothetical protein